MMVMAKGIKKRRDRGQRIIANMGLFWSRDHVRWKGHRGIGPARLAGKRRSAKTKGDVDFWKQTGVYALYADYRLVYVGQAGLTDKSCIGNRLKQHLTDELSGRWNLFSWFGLKPVDRANTLMRPKKLTQTRESHLANVLEGIIIEVAEPPMNSQKGRFGRRVERFIQVDDSAQLKEEVGATMNDKIESLEKQISETKRYLTKLVRQSSSRLDRGIRTSRKRLSKTIKQVSK